MSLKSVGSAPFALTVLTVLGLGGGLLLAFLPFNSAERTVNSPRRSLPDFQTLPTQNAAPTVEPRSEAEGSSRAEQIRTTQVAANAGAMVALKIDSAAGDFALPELNSRSSVEKSLANATAAAPINFSVTSEHVLTEIPTAHPAVGSYEAQQTAVIPEPSTWAFLLLGVPFFAFPQLLRQRLVRHSR